MASSTEQTPHAERDKRSAALASAALVRDGQRVGLGTGSTVSHLLPVLVARKLRCVATSPATATAARALGLELGELDELAPLEIAIDGADQVDPRGWLIKGGGGALTREKIVAAAASRFVVIVSADKVTTSLSPPVPLELLAFGARHTMAMIGATELRSAPLTPDGNLLADYHGPIADPGALAARLSAIPGVVEHGLFAPSLVSDILIGDEGSVEHRVLKSEGS